MSTEESYEPAEAQKKEDLITVNELCEMLRVVPKTIYRWDQAGLFKRNDVRVLRTMGGHRRFFRAEAEAFHQRYLAGVIFSGRVSNVPQEL